MTAIIWPPIDNSQFDSTLQVNSYFSWFFGHIFDEILIPFSHDFTDTNNLDFIDVSTASMSDYDKITHINYKKIHTYDFSYAIITEKDISNNKINVNLQRMLGSIPVKGINEVESERKYYYIGSPKKEIQDAYFSVTFTYWYYKGEDIQFLEDSKNKLKYLKNVSKGKKVISVFGTGPSLTEALDDNFDSSFNIVCNTIIKNKEFCSKAGVDIILATDAHFHFSYHAYSARFLSDLLYAIEKFDAAYFTFDKFGLFLRYRVPNISSKIFGIPAGRSEFGFDLNDNYAVFPGESVVNMFMLPFAMYLGDNIEMYGFTGRSPSDQFFWDHSDKHQYSDLMPTVRRMHPAFFMNRDYEKYSDKVDEQINMRINIGRNTYGKHIRSCTTSFYQCFTNTRKDK